MNLYILTREAGSGCEYIGKVVLASDEIRARQLANEDTADEGKVWESREKVDCRRVLMTAPEGVLLASIEGE